MTKRILVIDDEPELVKAIQIRLEQAGYETLIAYDGMEGLDKARKEKPDLILLDLMLPKMDGYKVCALLKRDKKYSKIPFNYAHCTHSGEASKTRYRAGR